MYNDKKKGTSRSYYQIIFKHAFLTLIYSSLVSFKGKLLLLKKTKKNTYINCFNNSCSNIYTHIIQLKHIN